jgi:hypothetical protein
MRFVGERSLGVAIELRTLAGEPGTMQTRDPLANRILDRLTAIRKDTLAHEAI